MGGIGHGKHCIGAQDGYVPFPYQSGDKKTGRGCLCEKWPDADINAGGFPFQVNEENAELIKARAMERLMKELEAGEKSGELIDEAEAYRLLGVTEL